MLATQSHVCDAIRSELSNGLMADCASISPKYFYDNVGSQLFEVICQLPEYYPTRTEAAIFDQYLPDMAKVIGSDATLIDLGAGNCAKAARLFSLLQPRQYVPIDISADHLRDAVQRLQLAFPAIEMLALGQDFSSQLDLPPQVRAEKRLFFYPGSSIGNFAPDQARQFLRQMRAAGGHDGSILLGADLIKDKTVLDAAYDDALGVTGAFNLNALRHVNRLLGSDFDVADWQHVAGFHAQASRIEMHLQARRALCVRWPGGQRMFAEGERIHTENSHKYSVPDILALLEESGFGRAKVWTDPNNWFAVVYAKAF